MVESISQPTATTPSASDQQICYRRSISQLQKFSQSESQAELRRMLRKFKELFVAASGESAQVNYTQLKQSKSLAEDDE